MQLVEVTEGRDAEEMEVGRSFEEDPVEWMLTSTDQMLNEMEKNPDSTTEAIWKISNSPIGKGTAAGVRTAAKLTIKAGNALLSGWTPHTENALPRPRGSQNGSSSWKLGTSGRNHGRH